MVQRLARRSSRQRGQSLVEFALIFPILALLLIAIADLARWYTSAIAVQAAAREAADYGSFRASSWAPANVSGTIDAMKQRACTGTHNLPDYQGDPPGPPGMTCTNPTFVCEMQHWDGAAYSAIGPCSSYDDTVHLCSEQATEPPCRVKVTLQYTFHLFFGIPPMPTSISFDRESTFALSSLRP